MSRKLILATGILGGLFLAGQAAATTLTFATNSAPTGLRGMAEKNLIDTIQAETDLKVKAFWGASLVKGKEVLTAVQKGIADIGPIQINYHPKKLLLNSALNLFPQGPTKFDTMMAFYDKVYAEIPELNAEFAKFDQRILYRYAMLPYAIASNKPLTKLEDLKGLKIRAASRWYLKLLADAGAIPVSLPFSDCYMALQTGTINGVFTNYDAIARVKMDEVAQNLYIVKQWWLPAPFFVTISTKKWDKLSAEQQKALTKAAALAEKKYGEQYVSLFDTTVAAEKKAGYTISLATDADVATWMKVPSVEGNRATWIQEAKDLGVDNAEVVLNKIGMYVAEAVKAESAAK